MALKLKKPVKKPTAKKDVGSLPRARIAQKAAGLSESKTVKVFDIPVDMLVDHSENPNVQSEKVHDELIEKIRRDGFDEPIIVVPHMVKGKPDGKYLIVSGHHRKKAGVALGMGAIPAVIREGWNEDLVLIELINRNTLGGNIDPYKFTEAFEKLQKRYDPEQLKKMMGLSEKKAFDALFKKVKDSLPPKQKKKLEEAKEKINSVDDLTGILHEIFKEHGSELDFGFLVFSHGGQEHHYVQLSKKANADLKALEKKVEDGDLDMREVFATLLADSKGLDNVIERIKNAKQATKPKAA